MGNVPNKVKIIDAQAWYQITSLNGAYNDLSDGVRAYNQLLCELNPGYAAVTVKQFEAVLRLRHELIVLLCDRVRILGTAQASLSFPGCRPKIVISNVALSKGVNKPQCFVDLVLELERRSLERFRPSRPVRMELQAQALGWSIAAGEAIGYCINSDEHSVKLL